MQTNCYESLPDLVEQVVNSLHVAKHIGKPSPRPRVLFDKSSKFVRALLFISDSQRATLVCELLAMDQSSSRESSATILQTLNAVKYTSGKLLALRAEITLYILPKAQGTYLLHVSSADNAVPDCLYIVLVEGLEAV
jgi:hypothetical protein